MAVAQLAIRSDNLEICYRLFVLCQINTSISFQEYSSPSENKCFIQNVAYTKKSLGAYQTNIKSILIKNGLSKTWHCFNFANYYTL